MDAIHRKLDAWLGKPKWKQTPGRVAFRYRFTSETEPVTPMRLKIEINTDEHFSAFGTRKVEFELQSIWHSGQTMVRTFALDEMLGTKLRALYQRKKGRDLYDLWAGLSLEEGSAERVMEAFQRHLEHAGIYISRAEFEANLRGKLMDPAFREDILPLLAAGASWDADGAAHIVQSKLIARLPGRPWKGTEEKR
jgi:hypothetical protein